jgi:hypothetical protein
MATSTPLPFTSSNPTPNPVVDPDNQAAASSEPVAATGTPTEAETDQFIQDVAEAVTEDFDAAVDLITSPVADVVDPPESGQETQQAGAGDVDYSGETINPWENAVCVAVKKSKWGVGRKADMNKVETDADKKFIRVTKHLIDCKEYKAITKLDGEIERHLADKALPSLFRAGFYLVAKNYVKQLRDELVAFKARRVELVQAFVAVYEDRKEEARQKLASQFNPVDYPPVASLPAYFDVEWQFIQFGAADALRDIDPDLFEEEREKIRAEMRNAGAELVGLMRNQAAELIGKLVDKLTAPADEGKKKVLRSSTVQNLTEFLDFFDVKNSIVNDKQLADLVKQAKEAMTFGAAGGAYVNPEDLRTNDALRDSVREKLALVSAQLDGMLEEKSDRQIIFAEDEGEE